MDGPTLEQARASVMANLHRGTTCPCCQQLAAIRRRRLNRGMAKSLEWLVHEHERSGNAWIDVPTHAPKYVINSREFDKLKYWDLMRRAPKAPGLWQATDKGRAFVRGEIRVLAYALIYNRQVVGWSRQTVSFDEALKSPIDLDEVTGGTEPVDVVLDAPAIQSYRLFD